MVTREKRKSRLLTTAHLRPHNRGVPSEPKPAELIRADFAGRGLALFALGDGEGAVAEGAAPTTIPLAPVGDVEARDGRFFRLPSDQFEAIKARTATDYPDGMPLDLRHDTETPFAAPDGNFPAGGAAGWFKADTMRIEDFEGRPMVVADVEWTEPGRRFVAMRLFRYISPVFFADPESRVVEQFKSAALTNNPALNMPALNEQQSTHDGNESTMNEQTTVGLRAVFGLAKEASKEELFAHCVQVKKEADQLSAVKIDLENKIAECDAAKELLSQANDRIGELEAANAATERQAFEDRRSAVLDEAIKSGKITPAQREHYSILASDEDGLTRLSELFKVTPQLSLTKRSEAFANPPKGDKRRATAQCSSAREFSERTGLPLSVAQQIWDKENTK